MTLNLALNPSSGNHLSLLASIDLASPLNPEAAEDNSLGLTNGHCLDFPS